MKLVIKRITKNNPTLVKELFSLAGERYMLANGRFINDKRNILLVAYNGINPCGFLYAYLLDQPATKIPQMYLHSIDVFPKYRRQGIGSVLINSLKTLAKHTNCSEIFLITNTSNLSAMKLYQGTGGNRDSNDEAVFVYKKLGSALGRSKL